MRYTSLFLLVGLMIISTGCQTRAENRESPPAAQGGTPNTPGKDAPPAKVTGIGRRMQVAEAQNHFRTLGQAYSSFEVAKNRGPRNLEEFAPEFQNQAKIMEHLKNGWWVFIYNVNRPNLMASAILAYEAQVDLQGNRLVLFGDGSVRLLDEDTFQKTPKAR